MLGPDEVFARLKTRDKGLSEEEAASRLQHYGPNVLPHKPPTTAWEIFLHQFKSPLIYILLVAAVISVAVDEITDAVFIVFVLLLNAIIGVSRVAGGKKR